MNKDHAINTLGREALYVRPVGGNWQVATRKPIAHYATKEAALDCAARMAEGTPGHYVIVLQDGYEEEPETGSDCWFWMHTTCVAILIFFGAFVLAAWIAHLTR